MSLVFTFPCATNQAKALTLVGVFDFYKNLAKRNEIGFEKLDKAAKKIFFTVNKPEKAKKFFFTGNKPEKDKD